MAFEQDVLGAVPVTARLGTLEAVVVAHVGVLEDAVLVAQATERAHGRVGDSGEAARLRRVAQAILATLLRLFAERAAPRATKPAGVAVASDGMTGGWRSGRWRQRDWREFDELQCKCGDRCDGRCKDRSMVFEMEQD